MSSEVPTRSLQLKSLVKADQTLEIFLEDADVPSPAPGEVLVRVEAAPINPSDVGLMFAGADIGTARCSGPPERPVVSAPVPAAAMRGLAARVGIPVPVGNEGAGTVVAAGSSSAAQELLGRKVAVAGGGMYSQFRRADAALCLALPVGASAEEGASALVNPMTALGMVETMRLEGHKALVHTAAASSLGQMLRRLCIKEDVPLVNIVRRPEQEEILRSAGAAYVCNSGSPRFMDDLTVAITATSATLAFDAIGGGKLASQILTCMEAAVRAKSDQYSLYGSPVHKQVYIYGGLDGGATELTRNYGMAWGIGGWLIMPFLQRVGPETFARMRRQVAEGLRTTFASSYSREVSLADALQLDAMVDYRRAATGAKYLVNPNK